MFPNCLPSRQGKLSLQSSGRKVGYGLARTGDSRVATPVVSGEGGRWLAEPRGWRGAPGATPPPQGAVGPLTQTRLQDDIDGEGGITTNTTVIRY